MPTAPPQPPHDEVNLARNLKQWRIEAGFTQELAAVWLEMKMVSLQRTERGERGVDVVSLRRMASLYGRDWREALLEKTSPPDFSAVLRSKTLYHPALNEGRS